MKERNFENVKDCIGKIILVHRMRKNLSQFHIASEIGVSSNQIGRIERGETNPTIETLFKISDYLGIDFSQLFLPLTEQKLKEIISEIDNLRSLQKSKSV
ncbi:MULTISPECIES: helix-turn-helix domain-containing protein [Epilithonimonas]|uniref:helix-turn-helix domain-containing protein n=1 Tax=Epilithonimonas TaxID=2782229 RepID=UPI0025DF4F43|nr:MULTISPECIES: helix-turn-helix transcriptional regulator [Epilithonimonas]